MIFRFRNVKILKFFSNLKFENNENISSNFKHTNYLENYHIPLDENDIKKMLDTLGENDLNSFISKVVPENLKTTGFESKYFKNKVDLNLLLADFKEMMKKNKIFKCYIGQGFYPNFLPEIIKRCVLENPAWYTAYTPYQSEISQGRLESLYNYQTLIKRLTGLNISNSSLLDQSSSCCEAILMAYNFHKKNKNTVLVEEGLFENNLQAIKTVIGELKINIKLINLNDNNSNEDLEDVFAFIYQSPNKNGIITENSFLNKIKENKITLILSTDLMSLVTLEPSIKPNICIGSSQRFGVAMGYGGPYAAFISCDSNYLRNLPGRLIGKSIDMNGDFCYRMSLQTREQHIKREKATSNICTSQVLLANIASFYAIYHNENGLKDISNRIRYLTKLFIETLKNDLNFLEKNNLFDTVAIRLESDDEAQNIKTYFLEKKINLNINKNLIRISFDETKTLDDIFELANLFKKYWKLNNITEEEYNNMTNLINIENKLDRKEKIFKDKDIFNKIKGEHELLRYITYLEKKDIALNKSMIPLGSCTMKLNSAYELAPLTWDKLNIHPFVENFQAKGYLKMLNQLSDMLLDITKMECVSFQSNSGSTGEYLGLKMIKDYHNSQGNKNKNICLIPNSAHGTNAASAKKIGYEIVNIKTDKEGNIDINDLKEKAEIYSENIGAIMITYPSTHGVYEENIKEYIKIVKDKGGLVYLDGANMNAQIGFTSPGELGADVCHLNLHKTFCIPHGGGGPGMGPICGKYYLLPFLPNHCNFDMKNLKKVKYPHLNVGYQYHNTEYKGSISQSQFTSASILSITYLYIKALGYDGMKKATTLAMLNANYICNKLKDHYEILYTNKNGYNAHEFIIDIRKIKKNCGITEEDISKRLIDYGFHAPTVSFPIPGTLMIEPTESENLEEINRFIETMINIRMEIKKIENGELDKKNNMLKNSPHTEKMMIIDDWKFPYTRKEAAFPLKWIGQRGKIWPSVGRVDNTYGDKITYK